MAIKLIDKMTGEEYGLPDRGKVTVGRARGVNDIVLPDRDYVDGLNASAEEALKLSAMHISRRRHLEIILGEAGAWLTSYSPAGTYIDANKLPKGVRTRIKTPAQITLGGEGGYKISLEDS